MRKINLIPFLVCAVLLISCGSIKPVQESPEKSRSDFEDGTEQAWTGKEGAVVTVAGEEVSRGNHSLLTTGRNNTYQGPVLDVTGVIELWQVYKIKGWIKIKSGGPASEVSISLLQNSEGIKRPVSLMTPIRIPSGTWFVLEAEYTHVDEVEKVSLCFESDNKDIDFYIDDVVITRVGEVEPIVKKYERDLIPIYKVYEDYFDIGAAVEPFQLIGEEKGILNKHFNSITGENAMKPESIQPEEGRFTFENADALVNFAMENNKRVRGHTLLWHRAMPEWFFVDDEGQDVSRDVLLDRLETHIKTLVGRYKGKIYAWDVVNEVIDVNAGINNFRTNKWLEIIGEDYVELAFKFAHEADPGAKLFINDFDTFILKKGDVIFDYVKSLLDKDVPVHGVGMQFHVSIVRPGISAANSILKKFAALGLDIHITEVDMTMYQSETQVIEEIGDDLRIRQGHRYSELMNVFKENSEFVQSVTFWNFHDGSTWLTRDPYFHDDEPLIFTEFYKAKYAYWGIVDPSKLPEDVVLSLTRKEPDLVEALKGTPVIDGETDEVWAKANVIFTEIFILGSEGAIGEVRVLWDEDNLYVLAHVRDDNLRKSNANSWEQDTLEIFVDQNNEKTIDYQRDDSQYRINFDNDTSFGGFPTDFVSATKVVDDGYIVECSIALSAITPAPGVMIGFDAHVNDDQGSGARDSYCKWNDPTNEGWRSTAGFGNLLMVE